MSCFGGTPVALKEEYLKNTPFFLLAAETDDATILPELAKYAKVAKFNASAQISDKLAYNTFVVVVEGELIHSDITAKLSTSTTSKIFPVDEIVATRKTGDFFRVGTPRKSTAAKWAAARAAAMELSLQSVCQVLDDEEAEAPTAADDAAPVRRSSAAARASLNWG